MTLCGWFKSDEQFITAAEKCCTSWIGNMETAEATSLGIKHNWIHIILDLWVQSQWTRIALLNGKVSFESRISIFKNKQFSMRWLTTVVGKKKEKKSNTRTFLRKISHQFHYSHAADIFANLYIYTNIMFIYTFFFLHLDGLLQLQMVKLQQKGGETDRDTQTHKHAPDKHTHILYRQLDKTDLLEFFLRLSRQTYEKGPVMLFTMSVKFQLKIQMSFTTLIFNILGSKNHFCVPLNANELLFPFKKRMCKNE